jgi:hypothetical protein
MIMLSFNMAAPDLVLSRSCSAQPGHVSEVTDQESPSPARIHEPYAPPNRKSHVLQL